MAANLVLLKKNGSKKSFPLKKEVTVIGRHRNCDLRIPLASVSKKHCKLNQTAGVLKIRDLNSRNGTLLNGKRIDEAELKVGDSIKIGPLELVLQEDGLFQPVSSKPSKNANIPKPDKTAKNKKHQKKEISSIDSEKTVDINELDSMLDNFFADDDLE